MIDLPQAVRQTRERLLELLAELDPAAPAWVRAQRAGHGAKPSVVVVGETNRGKSSLVNALLATPNASTSWPALARPSLRCYSPA